MPMLPWLLLKLQWGGVPEALFQKNELPSIDRIKEILYEIVNAQQGTAASISEDGDTNEETSTQLNITLDPVSKEIVEKIQGIINSPQAISSDEDGNIDEQIDEYAKEIYEMLQYYKDALHSYSFKTPSTGESVVGCNIPYWEGLVYSSIHLSPLGPLGFYVGQSKDEDGGNNVIFFYRNPSTGVAIDTTSSYEGLTLIGHMRTGDSESGILFQSSQDWESSTKVRISDRGVSVNGKILSKLLQLDTKIYGANSFYTTTFGESTSSKYVAIGGEQDYSICIYDDSTKNFYITYGGLIKRCNSDYNAVFASGRMVNIGDSATFNESTQILPAIAPLVTDELSGTSTYFVPNCHLKNVKSLSSTAEITYNDKTYTLNMDKAIELGLFVESASVATTSEESTETA